MPGTRFGLALLRNQRPAAYQQGAVDENSPNLVKIAGHRADLRFQTFPQVRPVLTPPSGEALVSLPSTTGTFDLHLGGDPGRPAGRSARGVHPPAELVPGPVGSWAALGVGVGRGATTRDRPGCPVDNGTAAAAGRPRVGPKGTRAGSDTAGSDPSAIVAGLCAGLWRSFRADLSAMTVRLRGAPGW